MFPLIMHSITQLTIFILSILLIGSTESYETYSSYQVLRIQVKNELQLKHLAPLEASYDFWISPRIGFVDIMSRPDQNEYLESFLRRYDFDYKIHIPDVGILVEEERQVNKQSKVMEWSNYQRVETIHAFLDDIATQHPTLARIQSIGSSIEGRDMKLIKLGTSGAGKPAIWMDAGIHAREWITPAVTTWIINELLTNSAEYADLLNSVDFYILSTANPDGYEHSHDSARLWRKNRRDTGSIFGCMGVDPNRNFAHYFGGLGSSSDKCSEVYRGEAAFSEPETKAIEDFVFNSIDVNWQLYIAVHSYSQLILTPWGYTYELPTDFEELRDLGVLGANALTAVHGTQYSVGAVTQLLSPGAGGSDDWAKGLGGFKYSYTYELRDTGTYGFILPKEQIIPTAEETFQAVLAMANFIAESTKK